jgi:flagellar hook-associated protein 1 FlgK
MSLNGALSIASRSLDLFSLGIQVAGNNIANAATPGYVRDELRVGPVPPYYSAGVLIGNGTIATGVRQIIDSFLETRIHAANTDYQGSQFRAQAYLEIQNALRELGDQDLSTGLNQFIEAVQNAANQPNDPALRTIVIQQGQRFADQVTSLRAQVEELRAGYSDHIRNLVDEANGLINQIAALNPKIGQLEAYGVGTNQAGTLRVERLNALNRLSEIIPIRIREDDSGQVEVFTGSEFLVLNGTTQNLQTVMAPTSTGVSEVSVETTRTRFELPAGGGELGGVLDARDRILSGFIEELDRFVGSVIFEFNKMHSGGEGLRGFESVTSEAFVNSTTAALNAAGLPFTPQHGSFQIKMVNAATGAETVANIGIDLDGLGPDMSLEDLRAAIDGLDNVSATITSDRRLQITADAGYEIRFSNDTSGVLAALGINTFFSGNSSDNIGLNARVASDQRYFASGRGGGPSDNSNVLELAQILDRPVDALNGISVDQFYTNLVGNIAQAGAAEQTLAEGSLGFRDSLKTQREQRSGVSIDEEAIKVMGLQRNYQAAARIISTIDELLATLLQI